MRVPALVVVALLLVAACSHGVEGRPQASSSTPRTTHTTSAAPTSVKPPPPQAAPAAGAPIADVISWIQAGEPADPAAFHTATRGGEVTTLQNGDVAFVTPSGKASCMTDSVFSTGDLACLVKLRNPPPAPTQIYGEWVGDWIEYDGSSLTIGSVHGDPGRFIYGDGAQLPYGKSLRFGDYQCRSDETGVFCVNYARQSAARISDSGVQPFGCLQPAPTPPDVGAKFSC